MTRFALKIHPDDEAEWLAMTGRDETRPYDMPPLRNLDYMLDSAQRNGVRIVSWSTIPDEEM